MQERLKRWESPRKQGRNDKGKGGSARARQLKKQTQMLRRKLKESSQDSKNKSKGDSADIPDFYQKSGILICESC